MKKIALSVGLLVLAVGALSSSASAAPITLNFACGPEPNSADNCTTIATQITATVDGDATGASFTIQNAGPIASVIDAIYFQDLAPMALDYSSGVITDSGSGVNFSVNCTPPDAEGGLTFSKAYCADADAPAPTNGVGPLEWVKFTFDFAAGMTFADLLADLQAGTTRIALHVIAFPNGGSEWAINTPPGGGTDPQNPPIPEPATLFLLGSGLSAVAYRVRRKMA